MILTYCQTLSALRRKLTNLVQVINVSNYDRLFVVEFMHLLLVHFGHFASTYCIHSLSPV
jgi:hypothetical protein